MARKTKATRKRVPKTILKLPDLEQSKSAVLNSLISPSSQRSYDYAIREFIDWYCSEPRLAFNKTVVTTEATADLEKNEAVTAAFRDRLPIGRAATPNDIAGVIAFLASEDAVFINGVILPVDGGLHASNGQPNFLALLGQG